MGDCRFMKCSLCYTKRWAQMVIFVAVFLLESDGSRIKRSLLMNLRHSTMQFFDFLNNANAGDLCKGGLEVAMSFLRR